MFQDLLSQIRVQMKKAIEHFAEDIKTIRTGRAQAALVEGVEITYYGARTPLKQIAAIQVPDAHTLVIQPWDPKSISDIEQGVREAELGLNPMNDGRVIRIGIPPLTAERRAELVKLLHKMGEEARVVLRGLRKTTWEEVQKLQKEGQLTEDDKYHAEEQLNKVIDEFNIQIEDLVKQKEADILSV